MAKLVRPKKTETGHHDVPFISGAPLSISRMVIMHTGATYDMLNKALVDHRFPQCARDLLRTNQINTSNGKARVEEGVRIKSGPWDCTTGTIMMDNSPIRHWSADDECWLLFCMGTRPVPMLHLSLLYFYCYIRFTWCYSGLFAMHGRNGRR